MGKAKNIFWILFWVDSALNIWAVFTQNQQLIYITKPLLMPLLALSLRFNSGTFFIRARNLVLFGLIFSFAGDTLLMFADHSANFFMFGLISFLLAHVCYITAFLNISHLKTGLVKQIPWLILPFVIYLFGFNYFLFDGVPSGLKMPVIIYSGVLMAMALSGLHLKGIVSNKAFQWIFVGALLFLISDSVLAAEKFKQLVSNFGFNAGIIIMATYILGQFGIARGIMMVTKDH